MAQRLLLRKCKATTKNAGRQFEKQKGDTQHNPPAAAVAVLHCIHASFPVVEQPVEVYEHDGKVYVTATRKCEPGRIMLPPCIPKQSKVHERSEHPYRIKIVMSVREKGNVVEGKGNVVEIESDQ